MLLIGIGVVAVIILANVAAVALGLLLLWRLSRVDESGEAGVRMSGEHGDAL